MPAEAVEPAPQTPRGRRVGFSPAEQTRVKPPPIIIIGLRVSGSPRNVSAFGESEISMPDLAASQNQVQVNFMSSSFAPGEVLRYQYKLEGAGGDWSASTEQRTVNFGNLAPGTYRFLVRAVNADGVTSVRPAFVTFTILPPIWRRWWFVALVSIGAGLIVYSLYRYRVVRVLEIASMRTRIATDLHDEIGANLTRIALLSELAKQQVITEPGPPTLSDNGRAESPLVSIARIARESVSSMSDIVWAINPERDSLLDLTRKMRQHADELFTLRDIDLRFNAPDAKDGLKLGADVRRDLLLIFKEAVNNAARHSRCSRVEIDFRVQGSKLLLDIIDNGIGFDQSIESQGQGLRSMKRRAAALGGTLEISSRAGAETSVRVSIPSSRSRAAG